MVIVAVLSAIEEEGFSVKGASFRQLSGKLWEIKVKAPSGGYRFLYVTLERETMIIYTLSKRKVRRLQ